MIHTYARDRAPADCAIHLSTWRYRWNCGCGDTGAWRRSEALAHQDWEAHVRRREEMRERAS